MHAHSSSCGCGGRRGWPANVERLSIVVGAVPALVRGVIGAIDGAWSNGMAGRTGAIRTGDGADPAYGFRGYVAYAADAELGIGAANTLRRGPSVALPSTSGDVTWGLSPAGATVMNHLRGLTPNGAR